MIIKELSTPLALAKEEILNDYRLVCESRQVSILGRKEAKIPAAVVPRTRILGQTDGVLKAIIHRETDQILGFTLFCAEAQELVNTVRLALLVGMTFAQLRDQIYTHPSMTEAFNYFD